MMIARIKNAERETVDALSFFTCILNTLAENVSGMKKNANSVTFVTLSASAIPRLLSTIDMFAINDV